MNTLYMMKLYHCLPYVHSAYVAGGRRRVGKFKIIIKSTEQSRVFSVIVYNYKLELSWIIQCYHMVLTNEANNQQQLWEKIVRFWSDKKNEK